LLTIEDGFDGLERLDGGVPSHVSTSNSLMRAVLQGIFREIRGFAQKRALLRSHFKRLGGNSLEKLAGNFFELAGKQQGIFLRNRQSVLA
jgi:hypothetical protein